MLASCAGRAAQPEKPSESPGCTEVTVAVAAAPDRPADQDIAGTLCRPPGGATTVQLLLPGGTYDRSYWTLRGDPHGPSYVDAMIDAGDATLAIDRLGTGESSHPHSATFTAHTQEFVAHQIVQKLRSGSLDGQPFTRVIVAGHSVGSTIARMLALTYPADVDGLVLTGESSTPNWQAMDALGSVSDRANDDPRLAYRQLDDGYVTLTPGSRSALLYHPETADPRIVATDEANPEPDVYSQDPTWGDPALNIKIDVPVLMVVGQDDRLLCGAGATDCRDSAALLAQQGASFGPAARLRAVLVPNTGHVLNLHRTASTWYPDVAAWARQQIA